MTEKSHFERTGKLQRKIDVYAKAPGGMLRYLHSTNWHRTCREAIDAATRLPGSSYAASDLTARFDKRPR